MSGAYGDSGSSSDPYGQSQASPYGGPQDPAATWSPVGAQSANGSVGQAPGGQQPYQQPPAGAQGYPQQPYSSAPGAQGELGPSRVTTGILGIFLGGFGVHRFLLGYTTIGIIQIAVTFLTCGMGAWWGLIEGILILAKNEAFLRDAHGRPLTE